MTSATSTAAEIRAACRNEQLSGTTAGLASEYIQANLIVLPMSYAQDFKHLCIRNPVPLPLITTCDGYKLDDIDIRTDLPLYNIFENGELIATKKNIVQEWTGDYCAFIIGCSFTFEGALCRNHLIPRHIQLNTIVPMYNTKYKLLPAGVFANMNLVVSMRPYTPAQLEKVRSITSTYVHTHGEPIAWGEEGMKWLGIDDIDHPDYGEATIFEQDEIPVFWGCGVTSAQVVSLVKGSVMCHAPGCMLLLNDKIVYK